MTAPRFVMRVLRAFSVCAAAGSGRAPDNVRRSAATACRAKSATSWLGVEALREQGVELVELRLRGVVVRKSGGALHLADDRIECAVGMLRRTEVAQASMWLGGEAFQQRSSKSRLADARLRRRATPLGLRRSLPSTSAAAGVRVLLLDRQARSGRSRVEPRSGFRLKTVAAPPRPARAPRCP